MNKLRNLNKYSWSIIVAFICATLAMLHRTANISFEGFFQTIPLIAVAIYYCERAACLINRPEDTLTKSELFARDLFLPSFSFLLACLIGLTFSYNNSDAKGWWSLIVYFTTLYGLLFSMCFSATTLSIKNHKKYTMVFSFLLLILVSLGMAFPQHVFIPIFGDIDAFYAVTVSLLIVHFVFIVCYETIRSFR